MGRKKLGMTPRKCKAAQLLVDGSTQDDAATAIGVCRRTIHDWIYDDDVFLDYIEMLRRRKLALAANSAQNLLESQIRHDNPWVAQNASNSLMRENNAVKGIGQQQIVVSFGSDTIVPGMPDAKDEGLPEEE